MQAARPAIEAPPRSRPPESHPSMSKLQKLLLLAALLGVGGLAAAIYRFSDDAPAPAVALHRDAQAPALEPSRAEAVGRSAPADALVVQPTGPEAPATLVTKPLRLELELVRATGSLAAEDAQPRRSGARSKLRGGLFGSDQQGVAGDVEFVAGPNRGRTIETDPSGAFGANDLYPGLSVVQVHATGLPGAQREIRLRNDRETQLNIGFGRPATVYGEVIDRDGEAIPFATVTMDGQRATTDEKGVFYFPRMTSGEVLAVVQKPGYASYRETLNISAAHTIPIGKLRFLLEPGASLAVTVQERLGAADSSLLFLEPDQSLESPSALFQRKFPWHVVSPVSIPPGGTVTIEDLPAMRVRLRLAHPGARATPDLTTVNLSASGRTQVVLHLESAPMLRGKLVMPSGEPVRNALVRLEAPDQARATADILGAPLGILESEVRPNLPPAVQSTYTDGAGQFVFSSAEELFPVRYLTAEGPGGKGWAGRVVKKGDLSVELVLQEKAEGDATLKLETLPRTQALPLDVRIDGAPRELPLLEPGETLELGQLQPGVWRVQARWGSERLLDAVEIEIEEEAELFVPLPDAARTGAAAAMGEPQPQPH